MKTKKQTRNPKPAQIRITVEAGRGVGATTTAQLIAWTLYEFDQKVVWGNKTARQARALAQRSKNFNGAALSAEREYVIIDAGQKGA